MNGDLRKKGILLLAALLLLLSAGVWFAYAWYTKMTSVSGLDFEAARWDYSANYAVGDVSMNVFSSAVQDETGRQIIEANKAAPGTSGYFPILLSAENSDVDVRYEAKVDKSTMSTEFRERIYFYRDAAMTLPVDMEDENVITGTIPRGGTATMMIYWKWIYEQSDITGAGGTVLIEETPEEFDAFDTKVGQHPDLYEPYMRAKVLITGTQIEPNAQGSAAQQN